MDSKLYWLIPVFAISLGVVASCICKKWCSKSSGRKKGEPLPAVPFGLINQGSTCYLNSVLQVLFMTDEICQALKDKKESSRFNPTEQVLKDLFSDLEGKTCETQRITEHLQIENVCQQRDAAEIMELLLNRLSHEVSRPFHGKLLYETTCSEGHRILKEPYPFWMLPLSNFSVQEGLDQVQAPKKGKLYCQQCEKETEITRECEMMTSPQMLTLLLKRFDVVGTDFYNDQSDVDIPKTIHIKAQTYSLCGVVDHWGSLRGGHYTATLLSRHNNRWYHFNDGQVQTTQEPMGNMSHSPYLLIYRKYGTAV